MLLPGLPDKHPLFSLISYMMFAYNFNSFPKCFTSDANKAFIFMLFKYLKINTRQGRGRVSRLPYSFTENSRTISAIYIFMLYIDSRVNSKYFILLHSLKDYSNTFHPIYQHDTLCQPLDASLNIY